MAKPVIPPIIYHDGQSIFLEWTGYAQRFPFTEGGLSKALKAIPHIASSPGFVTGRSNIATKLLDTRKARVAKTTLAKRDAISATDAQRQTAGELIRSLIRKGSKQ